MKMLIVDDEKHVRSTICKLVDWQSIGIEEVLEARDGNEAMRCIGECRPQIVITDLMMPNKSGLELLAWMEGQAPACKKIVISGYSEFEYARDTVKYGCMDYLLKPIDKNQLQEVVMKAIRSFREAKEERLAYPQIGIEIDQLKMMFVDKMLSRLLTETETEPERLSALWGPLIKEFPEMSGVNTVRVAALDLEMAVPSFHGQSSSDPDTLGSSMVRICNDLLRIGRQGVAFRNWNARFELTLFIWSDLYNVQRVLGELTARLQRETGLRIPVGVSAPSPFAGGIPQACRQAKDALHRRNLLEPAALVLEYQPSRPPFMRTFGFGHFEEEIQVAVQSGQPALVRAALQQWFDFTATLEVITVGQLYKWWNEYTVAKTRWMEQMLDREDAASLQFERMRELPAQLKAEFSLERIKEMLTHDLIEFMQLVQADLPHKNNGIHEIARYLQAHYREDIALAELSAKFHLNSDYISRKFKQAFQMTVVDYICRIRVDKAKLLLKNPRLKIAEVAERVGYQDEKYFSRVFKKMEQVSPRDYRERSARHGDAAAHLANKN